MDPVYTIAIGVVVDRKGQVLLICRNSDHKKGFWESPAGHIEKGETPEVAAIREIEEETGLSTVLFPKTLTFRINSGIFAKMFLARVPGGDSGHDRVKLAPREHSDHTWTHIADLKESSYQPQHANFRERVFQLLKMNNFPVAERDLYEVIDSEKLKAFVKQGDKIRIRKVTGEEIKGKIEEVRTESLLIRDSKRDLQSIAWNPMSSWKLVSMMRGEYQRDFLLGDEAMNLSDQVGLLLETPQGGVDDSLYQSLPEIAQMPLGVVQPSMFDFAETKVTLPLHRRVLETLQDGDLSPINSEVDGDRILVLFDSPRKAREAAESLEPTFEVGVRKGGILSVSGK